MARLLKLIALIALSVSGMYAGADTPKTVTVTFTSSSPRFTLAIVGNPQMPYADMMNVTLDLDLHLVAIPKEYKYTQEDEAWSREIDTDKLIGDVPRNVETLATEAYQFDQSAQHLLESPGSVFALADQAYNYVSVDAFIT